MNAAPSWLLLTTCIVSVLLIGSILLQSQGTGLGKTWSGGGESYHTKRGIEKTVFALTIVLSVVFFILSVVALFQAR